MLTKLYQRDEDYRFTDQLHQTALHTPDRAVLYDLVHSTKLKKAETTTEIPNEKPGVTEVVREFKSESIPATHTPEKPHEPVIQPQSEEEDEIASIISGRTEITKVVERPVTEAKANEPIATVPDVVEEVIADIPVADPEEESAEENTKKRVISASDLEPLDREILLEAISSSIELEVSETRKEEMRAMDEAPAEAFERPEENTATAEPMSMAAYLAMRAKELHFGEEKIENGKKKEILVEKQRENEKENEKEKEKEKENEEEENEEKNENENENERGNERGITEWPGEQESTTLSHGNQKIQAGNERDHQQALIDRFIKAEPRITPGKASEYSLQTAAKESLEEDFEFVTETMARLFAQQGKPDKARKAFKKLMEQHPEKSVYFAAQLKNLDRLKKP